MGWLNTGASVMFTVIVTGSIVTHHPPREPTDAFRATGNCSFKSVKSSAPSAHLRVYGKRSWLDNMLGAFPRVVAISSSNNDTSFKCLAATRTHFDLEAKKASYVWHLGGSRAATATRNVTFDIQEGNAPDQTTYFIDNDRTRPYTAYYNYTDYETCMVMIVPYNNHDHCLLWVKPAVAHAVPRHCLDNYEETCDVRVPQYDNDLCGHQE